MGAALSPTSFPGHGAIKFPDCAENLRSRPGQRRAGRSGPRAPPSGPRRGLQAGPPRLPARRTPTATQPVPLSGCTRPNPRTKTQNGCRQLRHVTPLCLSGPRTPRDPGTSGRGRRVALEGAPPGRGDRGSRLGEAGYRPGRRLRVGGEEKMAAILCGFAAPPPPQAAEGAGLTVGRTGELTRTDSSSFSIPVGICGTALFIEAYSCRSGRSSQRKTGSGFEASSARARNDSLLISGAADTSPLWGNGPGQRDHGEPGVRSPLANRCRGLEGRSAEPAVRALTPAGRVGGCAAPLLSRSLSSIRHGQHGGH